MIGTTSMYIIAHVSMYIVGLFPKKGMHLLRLSGYLIEKVVDLIFVIDRPRFHACNRSLFHVCRRASFERRHVFMACRGQVLDTKVDYKS